MKVLGLDISKTAGFAVWDTRSDYSSIVCGCLGFPEKASNEYCADQMGVKIKDLIKVHKPDFIVLETALKKSIGGVGATVSSCMLHGSALGTIGNFGRPWGTISSATWRKIFFEDGFKPEVKIHKLKKPDPKTGKMEKIEYLWKPAAIAKCEQIGILLPSQKTGRDDAAEACAIAICWHGAEIHAGRYLPAFTNFKLERNARAA